MDEKIKIIITDDKPRFRKEVKEILQEYNIETIAEAGNGEELGTHLLNLHPDVILLDLNMPKMDGNETMNYLNKNFPEAKVIIMSMHNEYALLEDFARRGAKGFIPKDEFTGNIELLVAGIKKVHKGGTVLKNYVEGDIIKFSSRQKEIIPLVADGKKTEEIAEELGLTASGVEKQRRKIMEKIGAVDKASFFKFIFQRGLNFLSRPNK